MINLSHYLPQRMFLMQGDQQVFEEVLASIEKIIFTAQALSVPRFTMEHARDVARFVVEGTGEERAFVIFFSVFSPDAAQVLLKALEEPALHTTVVFVTPYPYLVPKTVRSRVTLVTPEVTHSKVGSVATIISHIKKEALEKDDDPATRRGRAVLLLDELEKAVSSNKKQALHVYDAKKMLFLANMPTKFILDYVATVVR